MIILVSLLEDFSLNKLSHCIIILSRLQHALGQGHILKADTKALFHYHLGLVNLAFIDLQLLLQVRCRIIHVPLKDSSMLLESVNLLELLSLGTG